MPRGTVSANVLNRSIIRHVVKKSDGLISGVGGDYQAFRGNGNMVSATGFADDETVFGISPGEIAQIIAENNLTAAGIKPHYMNIFITACTDCTEDKLRREMAEMTALAKNRGLSILGGNTAFSGKGNSYSVTVNLLGLVEQDSDKQYFTQDARKEARAGDYVFVSGNAGHFGADQLIRRYRSRLSERFSDRFLQDALMDESLFRIERPENMYLVHDVSYGGIYRALYDLAEWTGFGINICHEEIPIRQDTIEICEFLDINPYALFGVGEAVGLFHEEELDKVKDSADFKNGLLHIAGRLTEKKEKLVTSEVYKMNRFLTPYTQDEIYREEEAENSVSDNSDML